MCFVLATIIYDRFELYIGGLLKGSTVYRDLIL